MAHIRWNSIDVNVHVSIGAILNYFMEVNTQNPDEKKVRLQENTISVFGNVYRDSFAESNAENTSGNDDNVIETNVFSRIFLLMNLVIEACYTQLKFMFTVYI